MSQSKPVLIASLSGHTGTVHGVHIRGDTVASASADQTAATWSLSAKSRLKTFRGHTDDVRSVIILGEELVSGSWDNSIIFWDSASGRKLIRKPTPPYTNALVSQGDTLVVGGGTSAYAITVWSISARKQQHLFKGHKSDIYHMDMRNDYIISASHDKTVGVWSISNRRRVHTLKGHKENVRAVSLWDNDTKIISASKDNTVRIWDMSSGLLLNTLEGPPGSGGFFSMVTAGKYAVAGSDKGQLCVFDLNAGSLVHVYQDAHSGTIRGMATEDDKLVSGATDKLVKVWKLPWMQSVILPVPQVSDVLIADEKTPLPTSPVPAWTSRDVRTWLLSLGSAYDPILKLCTSLKADGNALLHLTQKDIVDSTKVPGVVAKIFLQKLQAMPGGNSSVAATPVVTPAVKSPSSSSTLSTSSSAGASGSGDTSASAFADRVTQQPAELLERMEPFRGVFAQPLVGIVDAMRAIVNAKDSFEEMGIAVDDSLIERAEWALDDAEKAQRKYVRQLKKKGDDAKAEEVKFTGVDKNGLTCDMAAAITLYTQSQQPLLYEIVNSLLRNRKRDESKPLFFYLRLLLEAIDRLPKHTKPVWRGVAKDLSDAYDLQVEEEVAWWGFSSCTKDLKVLRDRPQFLGTAGDRTLFMITCTNAVNVSEYSCFPEEAEVLLPPAMLLVESVLPFDAGGSLVQLTEVKPKRALIS